MSVRFTQNRHDRDKLRTKLAVKAIKRSKTQELQLKKHSLLSKEQRIGVCQESCRI
jgi:hypothetical protein